MLHLISDAALSTAVIERMVCGDDVVLQSGSVWAALDGHQDNATLNLLLVQAVNIYALQDVLAMNGIDQQQLLPGVKPIDYQAFVELTVKNPVIQTWC